MLPARWQAMPLRTPCGAGSTGWKETTGAAPLSTLAADLPDRHPGADGRPPRSKTRIRYDLSNQSATETLPSAAEADGPAWRMTLHNYAMCCHPRAVEHVPRLVQRSVGEVGEHHAHAHLPAVPVGDLVLGLATPAVPEGMFGAARSARQDLRLRMPAHATRDR